MGIPPLLPSSFPTFSLSAHCRRHSSFDSPFPPPCCYHFAAPISSGPLPTQPPFLHLRQPQLQPSVQATSAATMHHRPPSPLPACTMHHSSPASTTTPHCYAVTPPPPLFSDQPRHRPPIRRHRCCTDHALIVAHLLAASWHPHGSVAPSASRPYCHLGRLSSHVSQPVTKLNFQFIPRHHCPWVHHHHSARGYTFFLNI